MMVKQEDLRMLLTLSLDALATLGQEFHSLMRPIRPIRITWENHSHHRLALLEELNYRQDSVNSTSKSICTSFITPRNSSQKRSELVSNPHVHARIIQSATEALFIPCASSSCRFYHQIESINTINSTQQLACTNKQEKKNISCVLLLFGAVQKKKRVNRGEQGWTGLTRSDQVWPGLNRSEQGWTRVNKGEQGWTGLTRSDQVWTGVTRSNQV